MLKSFRFRSPFQFLRERANERTWFALALREELCLFPIKVELWIVWIWVKIKGLFSAEFLPIFSLAPASLLISIGVGGYVVYDKPRMYLNQHGRSEVNSLSFRDTGSYHLSCVHIRYLFYFSPSSWHDPLPIDSKGARKEVGFICCRRITSRQILWTWWTRKNSRTIFKRFDRNKSQLGCFSHTSTYRVSAWTCGPHCWVLRRCQRRGQRFVIKLLVVLTNIITSYAQFLERV